MKIEIITSQNSNLKETGFGSLLACADVRLAIESMGHSVVVTLCETLEDLEGVVKRAPDLVVLATKYMPINGQQDVWFSEFFEKKQITFSGSNRATLRYDSDKVFAKERLTSLGVKTAKYFVAIPDQFKSEAELPIVFPLFLKPLDAANGNGIDDSSLVESFFEYREKVKSLYEIYNQPVLVEEYLCGKEFTVSVILNNRSNAIMSAIEIMPPESSRGLRILGAVAKKKDTETLKKFTSMTWYRFLNLL